jgi:hypothetical protein
VTERATETMTTHTVHVPQAVKGKVHEGKSLLQKFGEPLDLSCNFLLGWCGLLCGSLRLLMLIGFGPFPVSSFGCGKLIHLKYAADWRARWLSRAASSGQSSTSMPSRRI